MSVSRCTDHYDLGSLVYLASTAGSVLGKKYEMIGLFSDDKNVLHNFGQSAILISYSNQDLTSIYANGLMIISLNGPSLLALMGLYTIVFSICFGVLPHISSINKFLLLDFHLLEVDMHVTLLLSACLLKRRSLS